MQVCKSKKAFVLSVFLICSSLFTFIFAQSIEMPEMPEMPSMPAVGGGFYTPSFPNRPNKAKQSQTDTDSAKEKTESGLTEAITPESVLTSALSKSNTLTATDISSLYDSGLFSNISSLGGACSSVSVSSVPTRKARTACCCPCHRNA